MRFFWIVICIFLYSSGFGQKVEKFDKLEAYRGLFNTKALLKGSKQTNYQVKSLLGGIGEYDALRKYNRGNLMIYSSPVCMAGGIYLAYDAIKGTSEQVYDPAINELITYKVRPIENVITGLAVFAVGMCLLEFGNESKAKAINLYNKKVESNFSKESFKPKIGFTPSGNIGFYANF
ncbi:MAG: hypothetical protein ACRCVT_07575 [Leadbetterella sp.]